MILCLGGTVCAMHYVIGFVLLLFRGDFIVQWYHHQNSTCSVFLLLHYMAIVLLDKSIAYQEKHQGKGKPPVSTIYQRIFWSKHVQCLCCLP